MKVTVLGIGLMGYPMARRLAQAGFEVHAWNRTLAKAQRLTSHGVHVHALAPDAVRQANIVLTMLDDGAAVEQVLFDGEVAAAMARDSMVVDMSSIRPIEARDHAARLSELHIDYLDAPVSGGTIGAEAGTLAIMVGGKATVFDRALPFLQALGHPKHVGPTGAGQLAKLANQMIVGATIGAVAEALLLCERGGANMAKVREAITGGFADSRILQVHGQRMVDRDFVPRGRMSVQLKDLRNALATAQEIGFEAPITHLFEQLYADGVQHGLADLDHAGLFVELASRNGMV